jgi:hypothetical protein
VHKHTHKPPKSEKGHKNANLGFGLKKTEALRFDAAVGAFSSLVLSSDWLLGGPIYVIRDMAIWCMVPGPTGAGACACSSLYVRLPLLKGRHPPRRPYFLRLLTYLAQATPYLYQNEIKTKSLFF